MLSNRSNAASSLIARPDSIQRSLAPANVIQRKGGGMTAKELAPSLTGGIVNSTWTKIHKTYRDYMAATDPDKEMLYLGKLTDLLEEWKGKREDGEKKKKRGLISRLEAMIDKEFPEVMARAIGLPPALIAKIPSEDLSTLASAAKNLEDGKVGQADAQLQKINHMPGFNLIKSMLVRRYLGQVNPELQEAINNPQYEYKPENKKEEDEKVDNYFIGTHHKDTFERVNENPLLKVEEYDKSKKYEIEKKMYKEGDFQRLEKRELKSLIGYSMNAYHDMNGHLRNGLLAGNKNQGQENAITEPIKNSTAGSGHLIESASGEASELTGNAGDRNFDIDEMTAVANNLPVKNSTAGNLPQLQDSTGGNSHLIEDASAGNAQANQDSGWRNFDIDEISAAGNNAVFGHAPSVDPYKDDEVDEETKKKLKNEAKKAHIEKGRMAFTKSAISGLNKLRPFNGKVYRHSKFFPGYNDLNQVGGVVTDMGFTSSTFRIKSLSDAFGLDIMEIIYSKNGRLIKPISEAQGEDEVLFKPGTRFKVTKRADSHPSVEDPKRREWDEKLDAEMKSDLSQNRYRHAIKVVIVKEEV